MRKERPIMQSLIDLNLSPTQAFKLLTHTSQSSSSAKTTSSIVEDIVDASDREEGGGVIGWLNDLEKDERYSRWSDSINLVRQFFFHTILLSLFLTLCRYYNLSIQVNYHLSN